jgi:hypothetical protein
VREGTHDADVAPIFENIFYREGGSIYHVAEEVVRVARWRTTSWDVLCWRRPRPGGGLAGRGLARRRSPQDYGVTSRYPRLSLRIMFLKVPTGLSSYTLVLLAEVGCNRYEIASWQAVLTASSHLLFGLILLDQK